MEEEANDISIQETEKAVQSMGNGKALGDDGLPVEIFTAVGFDDLGKS